MTRKPDDAPAEPTPPICSCHGWPHEAPAQPRPAPDPEDRLRAEARGVAFELPCLCGLRREPHQGMCPALNREAIERAAHAALVRVVAEEREACARIAEAHVKPKLPYKPGEGYAEVAAAIRARGLEEKP